MDTDGFLNALTCMIPRIGSIQCMLSDNDTNFMGGCSNINQLVKQLDEEKFKRMTCNKGIKWHWNPPKAPHFEGVFE